MKGEPKKWLTQAERDFKSAKNSFKSRDYYLVSFLCHQAVEKALKSLYIKKGVGMDKKNALIKEIKKFKEETSREIPIEKVVFFGSRAEGKGKKHSDIDLIVVSKKFKNQKFRKRPVRLYNYWKIKYPVDFFCYTPEEYRKKIREIGIVSEAKKRGIEL